MSDVIATEKNIIEESDTLTAKLASYEATETAFDQQRAYLIRQIMAMKVQQGHDFLDQLQIKINNLKESQTLKKTTGTVITKESLTSLSQENIQQNIILEEKSKVEGEKATEEPKTTEEIQGEKPETAAEEPTKTENVVEEEKPETAAEEPTKTENVVEEKKPETAAEEPTKTENVVEEEKPETFIQSEQRINDLLQGVQNKNQTNPNLL